MLLKSIDLQGYKTFAGRTSFEFAGSITCIVGPNGSGKSNIADAIRWVLGEQSYRLLRGKKTEDMIFSGSEARSQAGMASCNIIFDNTSGWLPIDFSEVSITRRAYRDGNNEYLINGQRVRLKDITELLGSSGLSERTYTIIGQGLVDAALSLRAEERRRLFEEAAGVSIYRSRRSEAKRRLEATRRNLERVEDIMTELKPRLKSLERQARRAAEYDQVEIDLKVLLREFYGFHWYKAQRNLNNTREEAGIQETLYKSDQQEQTELNHNLTIIREQIQGLRARLGSWHRESSQLHNQRGTITRDLAVSDEKVRSLVLQEQNSTNELTRLSQQGDIFSQRLAESNQTIKNLQEELSDAQAQTLSTGEALNARKADRENANKVISEIRKNIADLTNHQNRLQASLVERQSHIERNRDALKNTIEKVEDAAEEFRDVEKRLKIGETALHIFGKKRQEADAALETLQNKLTEKENLFKEFTKNSSECETELVRLRAQLDVLESSEKALSGYASGTKLLLKTTQDGKLKGPKGALSRQLEVPKEMETAIVSSLGEYLDAVIVENYATSEDALELLVRQTARGTLLPMNELTPLTPLSLPEVDGVLGIASDIVKAPPELRPAVDLLLGQTLIVKDRGTAHFVLRGQPLTTRAVTLRGEVFYASGPISVGQIGGSSTLSRQRQSRELLEVISKVEGQKSSIAEEISSISESINKTNSESEILSSVLSTAIGQEKDAVDSLNQITLEMDRVKRQNQWQLGQLELLEGEIKNGETEVLKISNFISNVVDEISKAHEQLEESQLRSSGLNFEELQSAVTYWNTQVAVTEQALTSGAIQRQERKNTYEDVIQTIDQITQQISSFEQSMDELGTKKVELKQQESDVVEKIEALRKLIEPVEIQLTGAEAEQDRLQTIEAKARDGLGVSYRRYSQAQLEMTRKQELLGNLRERIENDLGLVSFEYEDAISGPTPLPLGEMVEKLPRVSELPDGMEKTIKRQRAQVRRMGAINPDAQEEYKEVKNRYEFMTGQVDDLYKAEKDVNEVIAELEALMEREFRKTFDMVAMEFREIFTRLFGGGSAQLVLTDPDDLTETGIDIEARLPGRRSQGLSLLSGGERSLTATALVFSLLKVSPTPFCVLDEVDAMLDEANVGRFRDLLRELAENTQFIVITHNRNTVQAADVIYGVTMGRDSASQVISLKLDEVAKIV